ncbi:unnamed protein product [Chondrus crispus]|uniref:Uncharacterized protein n=1 Tax=Chondrus crispus TaxID=2769 RepID=R7Q4L4_CHOCR|nr:unnamed protein product [Chondrus crispus]CDF32949.1 unnamed protein product [Chondrus crispus]|eukprot:XP_005712752.1 unnamed protein product [Chondrus crispus]
MIRDFGTLKKLGMVGEHAKIRVLSEMEEDVVDDVEEEQKRPASPGTRASEQKDSRESENEDDDDDEEGGADAEEEEEEEDDDFGVISVIPASRSKKEDPDPLTPEKGDNEANKPAESARRDATSPAKATPLERSEGKKTSSPSKQSPTNGDAAEVHAHAPDADPKTDTADENQAAPTPAATEDKMEEFYKKGTGPDGLLMLTRKQSLRVCACCGGFISLVDAESRLLSHYGGKSHHSLVQLRQKVADLENEIALERRLGTELSPRGFERGRRAESDTNRSRGDERRPSHGGSRDRYRGRHDRDDAHDRYAGADRYAAPHHRRDEGWRPREPRYRGREEDARLHPRYAYDRKRYRSRSPTRNHRRHRHRY